MKVVGSPLLNGLFLGWAAGFCPLADSRFEAEAALVTRDSELSSQRQSRMFRDSFQLTQTPSGRPPDA